MTDRRDVTGVWYGRWNSANRYIAPNSFIATLEERSSLISGTTTERDRHQPGIRRADIDGVRAGGRVEFTKQYSGGRSAHAVHYSGKVSAAGTEIKGTFRFERYDGEFVMARERFDAEELEDVEEIETPVPEKVD